MNKNAYLAARQAVVYVDRSTLGCVELQGKDRLDVVNRLSTNKVDTLQSGSGQQTVFTNHNGRIIDLVTIMQKDDSALLMTNAARGPEVAALLQRNKFFNDTFTVKDLSTPASQLYVYGPQAVSLLQHWSTEDLGAFALWQHTSISINDCPVRLQRVEPIYGDGWRLLTDVSGIEAIGEALDDEQAVFLDQVTFEVLRIEHGMPGVAELNLDYIPLESNLWDAVSFKKGCYVGQEIIARMESRGRLAKKLVAITLESKVTTPYTIEAETKPAGVITSLAYNALQERWVGLAYLRSAYWDVGTQLDLGSQMLQVVSTESMVQAD